ATTCLDSSVAASTVPPAAVSRTWQSLELFDDLTVFENLLVATRQIRTRTVLADLFRPRRKRNDENERWALDVVEFGRPGRPFDRRVEPRSGEAARRGSGIG